MKTKIEEKLEERKEKKKKRADWHYHETLQGLSRSSGQVEFSLSYSYLFYFIYLSILLLRPLWLCLNLLNSIFCIFLHLLSIQFTLFSLYTYSYTHIYSYRSLYIHTILYACKTPKYTHTFPSSQSARRPCSDPRPALTSLGTSASADAGSVPLTQDNLPDRY